MLNGIYYGYCLCQDILSNIFHVLKSLIYRQLIYDRAENPDLSQHKPGKNNTLYKGSLTSLKI